MKAKVERIKITPEMVKAGLDRFEDYLNFKIQQKGDGAFINCHEAVGAITEQYDQFKEAVHRNNVHGTYMQSMDICVAAMWAAIGVHEKIM